MALKKALTADDQCQAFCATASVAAADEALTQTVVMKRAVAQVNIKSDTQMTGYSKLTAAYTNVPNTFNVLDNTVTTTGGVSGDADFEITSFSALPGADGKYIYQSAYFLASADGAGSMLNIALDTYITAAPGTPFKTITVNNVPTKKNVRTNVLMDFAATSSTYTYTLDFADFDATDINHKTVSIWDGTYPAANTGAAFSGGDGSEATPYIIGSATDFAQFAENTRNNYQNYEFTYFKLDVDINLNDKPWTPTKEFRGVFDGQHHKITGLKVSGAVVEVGLFGRLSNDGRLSNLHVSGDVENTSSTVYYAAGGICGWHEGVITNCSFSGSVRGTGTVGGIAGSCNGKIISCKNTASVSGKEAGGIAGRESSAIPKIYGCYNEGAIDGEYAGGILGKNDGYGCEIKDATISVRYKVRREGLLELLLLLPQTVALLWLHAMSGKNMPLPMLRRKQYSVLLAGLLPQATQCGTPTQVMTVHTQQAPTVCLPAIISSGNPSAVGTVVRPNILSSGGRSKDVYTLCYRCVAE